MKKLLSFSFLLLLLCCATAVQAQQDKSKRPSPPATLTTNVDGLNLKIDYSQPAVKGRTIGKDIAPYGKVWRTGANEATTISLDRDVRIEGKELKAGTYTLFTIPGEDEWTIIFNKKTGQWGTQYDESEDALRVQVKPAKAPSFSERMTFSHNNGAVHLHWGDTLVRFNVQ